MRFPPRLTLDLAKVLIAQKLLGPVRYPLALRLDLAELPAQSEFHPDSSANSSLSSSRDLQTLALVRGSAAPLVWIGGHTPLRHARIAQITRDLVNRGRTVFVEMDGTLLRQRIFEFRPVSRLYLVLALNGLETAHDLRAGRTGNFRATVESIRAAKLSGFHVCVETMIFADTELHELRGLVAFTSKLDVDGWIQSRPIGTAEAQVADEEIEAARDLIPSRPWRTFSELLDLTRATETSRFGEEKAVKRVDEDVHGREEGLRAL